MNNNDLKNAWKDEDAIKEASGAKYDSIREAYKDKDSFWDGIVKVATETSTGQNTVGRIGGLVLDVATVIAPYGSKIDRLRSAGKQALNLNQTNNEMKDILKRAFTTDGGSFLRVRDQDGKISFKAIGATLIRLVVLSGALYLADYLGILSEFMAITGLR